MLFPPKWKMIDSSTTAVSSMMIRNREHHHLLPASKNYFVFYSIFDSTPRLLLRHLHHLLPLLGL
jgi:hypothetical protein